MVRVVDLAHLGQRQARHLEERDRLLLGQLVERAALSEGLVAHGLHERRRGLHGDARVAPQDVVPAAEDGLGEAVVGRVEADRVGARQHVGDLEVLLEGELRVEHLAQPALDLHLQVLDRLDPRLLVRRVLGVEQLVAHELVEVVRSRAVGGVDVRLRRESSEAREQRGARAARRASSERRVGPRRGATCSKAYVRHSAKSG